MSTTAEGATAPAAAETTDGRPPVYGRMLKAAEAHASGKWKPTDESAKQFKLFTAWRNLGPGRTITEGVEERLAEAWGGTAPDLRTVERLASRYRWRERAEQWDVDRDAKEREAIEALSIDEQVERYRSRQVRLASESMEGAILMARWVKRELAHMLTQPAGTAKPSEVARVATAYTQVAAIAGNAEAQAIGIGELLGLLDEAQANAQAAGIPLGANTAGGAEATRAEA